MVIFAPFWSFLLVVGVGVFWVFFVLFVGYKAEGLRSHQGVGF
jgi:hypothetical protein